VFKQWGGDNKDFLNRRRAVILRYLYKGCFDEISPHLYRDYQCMRACMQFLPDQNLAAYDDDTGIF